MTGADEAGRDALARLLASGPGAVLAALAEVTDGDVDALYRGAAAIAGACASVRLREASARLAASREDSLPQRAAGALAPGSGP